MDKVFGFSLPTRIEFGSGLTGRIPSLIREVTGGTRVFVVTDPGIETAGLVEPVLRELKKAGCETQVFSRVQPNPKDYDCEEGGRAVRDFQADAIVAVGGGSVLDSAKAVALLHTHSGVLQDYEGRGKVTNPVTPIVAIPTTAGTGSEVTRSAVITDTARRFKMTIKDVKLAPALAIVDPELTLNLPPALTASTGMDAFVHAIEAYTCRPANPFSDAWAREAMRLIFPSLRRAVFEGAKDRSVRRDMMLGSVMAGVAFSHADVAAVHCMAEALGSLYDTPHGVANSMFLPVVTEFNAAHDPDRHAEVAVICGFDTTGMHVTEAAELLVGELKRLAEDIGIPRFSGLDYVNPADFERLAEASFINGSTPSNSREITRKDYLELFKKAYR